MGRNVTARRPDEGNALWVLGGLYDIKAGSADTDGKLTVVEMTIPVGMGPPPHTHPGGEAIYVLEGTLDLHVDGETLSGGPGSFFYIPEGTRERFEPTGNGPLRVLAIYAPGGIDAFFGEIGERAPRREVPPAPEGAPDFERIAAAAARHGMEIEPPPGP